MSPSHAQTVPVGLLLTLLLALAGLHTASAHNTALCYVITGNTNITFYGGTFHDPYEFEWYLENGGPPPYFIFDHGLTIPYLWAWGQWMYAMPGEWEPNFSYRKCTAYDLDYDLIQNWFVSAPIPLSTLPPQFTFHVTGAGEMTDIMYGYDARLKAGFSYPPVNNPPKIDHFGASNYKPIQGSTVTFSYAASDPDGALASVTATFSDNPNNPQTLVTTGSSFAHTFASVGTFVVRLEAKDPDGLSASTTLFIEVINTPPSVYIESLPSIVDEGSAVPLVFKFTDSGVMETHVGQVNWDFGAGVPYEDLGSVVPGVSRTVHHVYTDDKRGTASRVIVEVTDSQAGTGSAEASIVVRNVAPRITSISISSLVVAVNTPVQATVSFTDPGTTDVHTLLYEWGSDGSTEFSLAAGVYAHTDSHSFSQPGLYRVCASVADDEDAVHVACMGGDIVYIAVYDPTAGYVTGGGWIQSPLGAYYPNPSLTGKATFGFISKYQKGAKIPTGTTTFVFHAAGMSFYSSNYQWLVVSGTTKAQYKGTGSLNGVDGYNFILTAIDGTATPAGVDKFRIKITKNSQLVYDNMLGISDDTTDTSNFTVLGGGSIVIHTKD